MPHYTLLPVQSYIKYYKTLMYCSLYNYIIKCYTVEYFISQY